MDAASFVICDKGYLGSGGDGPLMNNFMNMDPVSDTWIQKANTPGEDAVDFPSFSIGQKEYSDWRQWCVPDRLLGIHT